MMGLSRASIIAAVWVACTQNVHGENATLATNEYDILEIMFGGPTHGGLGPAVQCIDWWDAYREDPCLACFGRELDDCGPVVCSTGPAGVTTHVVALRLSSYPCVFIRGPFDLCTFTEMQVLVASNIGLGGEGIGDCFNSLPQLSQLDLSFNRFYGKFDFGGLLHLNRLDISHNYFDGEVGLQELLSWDYRSNTLVVNGNLALVDVSNNKFTRIKMPFPLEWTLGTLDLWESPPSTLRWLDASYNPLKCCFNSNVGTPSNQPWEMITNRNLEYLGLAEVSFNSDSWAVILNNLGVLTRLTTLDLSNNYMEGVYIGASIGNCRFLTSIDLSNCMLEGYIPASIGNLTQLTDLYLSNNRLNGSIPTSIGRCTQLTNLALNVNKLQGPIPSSVGNLARMRTLDLSNNTLNGSIPETIGNCKELVGLSVEFNHLTGVVPETIGGLANLHGLVLSHNALDSVPGTLGEMSNLAFLAANNNRITTLPSGLGTNNTRLTIVDFSSNKLHGNLPSAILKYPTTAVFFDNQLSGFASPMEVGTSLRLLSIRQNRVDGQLPTVLLDASLQIEELDLGLNSFSGRIPDDVCNATKLKIFLVDHNDLSGKLPLCLMQSSSHWSPSTFKFSCQGLKYSHINPTIERFNPCPLPFELSSSGEYSVVQMITSQQNLTRIDVSGDGLEFKPGGTTAPQPSLIPEYTTTVHGITMTVVTVCALSAFVAIVVAAFFFEHRGGVAALDRFPQYGFVMVDIRGKTRDHMQVSQPVAAACEVGGVFNVVKTGLLIFFIVHSLAVYSMEGMTVVSSTAPMSAFLDDGAVNITVQLMSLSGSSIGQSSTRPAVTVRDRWLGYNLATHGLTLKQIEDNLQARTSFSPASTGDLNPRVGAIATQGWWSYTSPLGWESGSSDDRSVAVLFDTYVPNAQISVNAFAWRVQVGVAQTGTPPNEHIASARPTAYGNIYTIPTTHPVCRKYTHDLVHVPPNCTGGRCTAPTPSVNQFIMPELNGEYIMAQVGKCDGYTGVPDLVVPARVAPEAFGGPPEIVCLNSLSVSLRAVPLTQTTPDDVLGGTRAYERRTFNLVVDGINYDMHDDGIKSDSGWDGSMLESVCEYCTVQQACPATTVTFTITKDTFGTSESLVRMVGWVQFFPSLLASCFGLAALFVFAYMGVGQHLATRASIREWSSAALVVAQAEVGAPEAGDSYNAVKSLKLGDGSRLKAVGCFTFHQSQETPNTVKLRAVTRDFGVVTVSLQLQQDKTVLLHHLRTSSAVSDGSAQEAAPEVIVKCTFKSMLSAMTSLTYGKVSGAEPIVLTTFVKYGSLRRMSRVSRRLTEGRRATSDSENTFFNPVYDYADQSASSADGSLHEKLIH
jgi:Leucine-rich repeat (LRR) protein